MAQRAPLTDRAAPSFASKNPFRNLVAENPTVRPISTNPFLDTNEIGPPGAASKPAPGSAPESAASPSKIDQTANLFAGLNFNDSAKPARAMPPPVKGAARAENGAPRPHPRGPSRHKHSNSEEERRRVQGKPRDQLNELDIFADPPDHNRTRERRTQRRNSESSVRDKPKDLDPEAEKRRRERKLREGKGSQRSKKPNHRLDVIDKLDVTSIYGTGLFHHDGPFDACNPHRNRRGARQAPMQAFPKDSANMQMGGSGPVNSKINLDQYNGTGQEANVDYNGAAIADDDADYFRRPQPERSASFNPTARVEPVHGSETAGLGTSTFLEGAPASRAAIQRREVEQEAQQQAVASGLSRTKSLAQRIKAVRPKIGEGGRMTSPEPLAAGSPGSPLGTGKSEQNPANPFFKDYDKEYEKKGAQIAFAEEQQKAGRTRAPSSPRRGLGLERKVTTESTGPGEEPTKPSLGAGFLNRVKSIKGGRSRTRERRNTEAST